ncbi:MAG: radical SAM protein [Pseudomonadota bacterium]
MTALKKFSNHLVTAKGEERAYVNLNKLETLWINTGTLCNIQCKNCYIESSPRNDKLVYITTDEVRAYLDEIETDQLGTSEIGITGGESFMNPNIIDIMRLCLERGFNLIVLTNAMQPMQRRRVKASLLELNALYRDQLTMRVSIDHFQPELHEEERGINTWESMIKGLQWLSDNNFNMDIAGRTRWQENEDELRKGYAALFEQCNIKLDANNKKQLVLFPEMQEDKDVPEITTACWDILSSSPDNIMCSKSRMVVKRKGASKPAVIACTLLPYDTEFELADTLKESEKRIYLNHIYCASFCVLGGGSCSASETH